MTARPETIAKALEQVGLGFAVFALGVDSKVPVTDHGFKNATTNPEWVRTQLSAASAGNYGMTWPQDAPPIVVFDLDDGGGVEGTKWRDKVLDLTAMYGPLPRTKTTTTPSLGRHAYYGWPADVPIPPGDELFGFTVRWPGRGYLVGPGSTIKGKGYVDSGEPGIAMLPDPWVKAASLQRRPQRAQGAFIVISGGFEIPEVIPSGRRYGTVRDYVASRYNSGLNLDELWVLVKSEIAPRFEVPKTEAELRADFDRATDKITERLGPPSKTGLTGQDAVEASSELRSENLADIPVEAVRWLWHRYLPIGSITLFDGNPGDGKSTVVADLFARLTRGGHWPDGEPVGPPSRVMYVTKEDDPAQQVRPRIQAAGGDVSMVEFVRKDLLFPRDTARFRALLEDVRPTLVLIDPLMSYLEGKVKTISDNDIRSALMTPLAEMARDLEFALLMIRHFNKGTGQSALNRGAGSLGGLVGAARMVVALAVDSQDDDDRTRIFGVVKTNLEAKPPSYKLVIESAPVEGLHMTVSRARWMGRSDTAVTDAMERTGEQQQQAMDATDSLKDLLANGPVPSRQIIDAMKAQGHTKNAVYAAKNALKLHVERQGYQGRTEWSLPVIRFVETTDADIPDSATNGTTAKEAQPLPAIEQIDGIYGESGMTVDPVVQISQSSGVSSTRAPREARCRVCHRTVRLDTLGRVKPHYDTDDPHEPRFGTDPCHGSAQKPSEEA